MSYPSEIHHKPFQVPAEGCAIPTCWAHTTPSTPWIEQQGRCTLNSNPRQSVLTVALLPLLLLLATVPLLSTISLLASKALLLLPISLLLQPLAPRLLPGAPKAPPIPLWNVPYSPHGGADTITTTSTCTP